MEYNRARRVAFASELLRSSFFKLKSGVFEEKRLAVEIQLAIDDLEKNPLVGIRVQRQLWPREYLRKYSINNLRKYDLQNGWRLLYTLKGNQVEIISIILEWLSHKEYEKKFGYKVK